MPYFLVHSDSLKFYTFVSVYPVNADLSIQYVNTLESTFRSKIFNVKNLNY